MSRLTDGSFHVHVLPSYDKNHETNNPTHLAHEPCAVLKSLLSCNTILSFFFIIHVYPRCKEFCLHLIHSDFSI